MKIFISAVLIVLNIMITQTFLPEPASGKEHVIRITNGEWEPYLSEYSYEYGLASHIISEAFKLEGVTVRWGFFPWKRAYEISKKGEEWDASAVWRSSEETQSSFFISDPVVNSSYVFFHLRSRNFDWKGIDDLVGLKIGGTLGYQYGREFMDAVEGKKISVDFVTSDEQNFKKLLSGRIDIFPNDPIVGASQIRNNFSAEKMALFTHHPRAFEVNPLHLIISRKSPDSEYFLRVFNSGLKRLHESGRIELMFKDLESGKYDKKSEKWIETR